MKEKRFIEDKYQAIRKQLSSRDIIDKEYEMKGDIMCWINWIYVPEGLRMRIIQSEYNSKVAGHFGRQCILELINRNFYWPNMETDILMFCNECDNCERTMSPRYVEGGYYINSN